MVKAAFFADENVRTEGTCLGYCCESFPIQLSKPERQRMIDWQAAGCPAEGWRRDDGETVTYSYVDARVSPSFIQDMLIPLEEYANDGSRRQMHTCRHWDRNTRLCTIYDSRPSLCRTYPNYGECDHKGKGCTYRRLEPTDLSPSKPNKNVFPRHIPTPARSPRRGHDGRRIRSFIRRCRRAGLRTYRRRV